MVTHHPSDGSPDTSHDVVIEVVCMGNICRSPLAAVMLQDAARRCFGDDAPVLVRSSGVHGWDDHPATPGMQREAAALGLDLSQHRSSQTQPADVSGADLVLTMTESQRRAVSRSVAPAASRVFTLREFARLVGDVDEPSGGPDGGADGVRARVRRVVAACHAARDGTTVRGEDVDDPYGRSQDAYHHTAVELETLVGTVADVLFGAAEARDRG